MFVHMATLERMREALHRLFVLRNHHHTARIFVESVHNAGAQLAANPGEVLAVMQEGVYQGAACMTWRWMYNETGWLIEDKDVIVLIKNAKRNFFRR